MQNRRPYIVLGIAALVILALFVYLQPEKEETYNWQEHYEEKELSPYGTNFLYQLLKTPSPENFNKLRSPLKRSLPDSTETESNYVFIGEGLYLDTADVNQLLSFAVTGNNVFIASKVIPHDLMYYIYFTECNDAFWDEYEEYADTTISYNFIHSELYDTSGYSTSFVYENELAPYSWHYIEDKYFCEEHHSFIPLGTINDEFVNFVKMPYGKGAFYLHTNPIAFSNIQLLEETGLKYINKVFSHLSDGPVYWDATSRIAKGVADKANNNYDPSRRLSDKSPLQYILSQPPLAWAWYLLLALILLYLLFRAKRRQRIIPVLAKNKNTSLEFISTIGDLYFLQQDHRRLSQQKVKLFYAYVRNHYHLSTTEINDEFASKLAIRSELPLS